MNENKIQENLAKNTTIHFLTSFENENSQESGLYLSHIVINLETMFLNENKIQGIRIISAII